MAAEMDAEAELDRLLAKQRESAVHRQYTVGTAWCGPVRASAQMTNDPAQVTCVRCREEMKRRE